MWSDAGYLSLVLIFAFWIGLVFLALATMMKRIRNRRAKPAGIPAHREVV